MKKLIVTFILIGIMILPINVFAEEIESVNLDTLLTEKGIEHDFSNYQETDDQAIIYLFYGSTCSYCKSFMEFLNSIVDDYGKYFKVVAYEVWGNTANSKLMDQVADLLDESADGVPFIVIGDQVFTGYSSSYDSSIKSAITSLYNSSERYDVLEELEKAENATTKGTSSTSVILWNFVFTAIATAIILAFNHKQNKKMEAKLLDLESKISKSVSKKQKAEK